MIVRPARGAARRSAATQRVYQQHSFPGPSLGWASSTNLAAGEPGAAYRLDNFFPTATGALLRRGCVRHASLGAPVISLIPYEQGLTARLLAVTDAGIHDVTTAGAAPVLKHTHTSGAVSVANYVSTDGILYVRGVNGEDAPWLYDGSSFTTVPALTMPAGDGARVNDLAFVWVFKTRFWFIRKNSLDAYYLQVGTIGGQLTKFSLGGVFRQGGSLVFGASWSQETGSGLSAMCVFGTDQGEVAVFQGSNPGDASDWSRVGLYTVGKPLGPNAIIPRGGDLAICTDVGLISLSQALLTDAAALSPTAMSKPIETEWSRYVAERYVKRWSALAWTKGNMMVVAPPTISGTSPIWLVANATTGKWARYTGWNANCLAVADGRLFFGSPSGQVYEANVTGLDDGAPFVGVYLPQFDQMGVAGRKAVHMARLVMRAAFRTRERLSVQADYAVSLPSAPAAAASSEAGAWGTAVWGASKWGDPLAEKLVMSRWRNTLGEGEALTLAHQITSGFLVPLDAEIVRTDVLFTAGEGQS